MAQLPNLSGKEVVKVFENLGWEFSRQSGSHIVLTKDGEMASLSVPNHKEVAKVPFAKFAARREFND